jgi:hypothetical protein
MVGQASSGLALIGSEFSKGLGFVEEQVAGTKLGLPPVEMPEPKLPELTFLDRLKENVSAFFTVGAAAPVAQAAAPAAGEREMLMRAIGAGSEKPSMNLQITGPLVNVEGSADRATAEWAADMVGERLKSVIVEASSSGAPSTSKMIRIGNRVTI